MSDLFNTTIHYYYHDLRQLQKPLRYRFLKKLFSMSIRLEQRIGMHTRQTVSILAHGEVNLESRHSEFFAVEARAKLKTLSRV